jgi:hypothetical protein
MQAAKPRTLVRTSPEYRGEPSRLDTLERDMSFLLDAIVLGASELLSVLSSFKLWTVLPPLSIA